MAVSEIRNAYGGIYESAYAPSKKETVKQEENGELRQTEETGKISSGEYLKSIQKQVPYVKLETGFGLSMKKDKRAGVITVNPKLLEKMKNDPEAAKKYTQTLKDIERAEKTGDAYYNALGGVVERTSHWYVDENGNFTHFAYVRRDDKLNKKIRKETQEKSEEFIEKTRKRAVEARKEQKKAMAERLEEKKADGNEKKRKQDVRGEDFRYGENIIVEFSKDGMEALTRGKEDT